MRNWLLLLLLLGLTLTAQERMALVIGNSAYRHWSHLKNPAQEVGQVAKQLRHCGFTLYRDRPLVDMSGAQMQELLTAFKRHILNTNIQVVLVYYAGHGFEFAGDQYLAPVDMPQDLTAKVEQLRKLLSKESEQELKRLALKELAISLKSHIVEVFDTPAVSGKLPRVNIFVLNACRDNPFRNKQVKKFIPPQIQGTFTIYATGQGAPAIDSMLFAEEFCRNLQQPDMTLPKLAGNLKTQVWKHTRNLAIDHHQDVVYDDQLIGNRDSFIWGERSLRVRLVEVPSRCQGRVQLRAQVDPEPTQVEFVIDGEVVGRGNKSGPYWGYEWDSTRVSNGPHALVAQAVRNRSGGEERKYAVQPITIANPQPERPVVPEPSPSHDPRRQLLQPFLVTTNQQVKLELTARLYYDDYPWRGDQQQDFAKRWEFPLDERTPLKWSDKLGNISAELNGTIEVIPNRLWVQGHIQLDYAGRSVKKALQGTLANAGESLEQEVKLDDHWCKLALQLKSWKPKSAFLDMSSDAWQKLAVAEQIKLARIYQQWYAGSVGLPVEKAVVAGGTKIVLRLIPPGRFWMGSPENEEGRGGDEKRHRVVISQAYWLAKTEVTQGVWEKIMGENPCEYDKGANRPVQNISWDKCQEFCRRTGSRLPSEAEWEYACRAGTTSKYYWGDSMDGCYAWYYDNSGYKTHAVGEKEANAFGLYDMSGNVWEWCQDRYGSDYYSNGDNDTPTGPSTGSYRVYRGGSFLYGATYCRGAYRLFNSPGLRIYDLGLRVAAQCR